MALNPSAENRMTLGPCAPMKDTPPSTENRKPPTGVLGGKEPMASNERKRQQQLVRKAAKRKQKALGLKTAASQSPSAMSPARQMQLALASPIHECLVPETLFELGIGDVLFSRKLPNGDIAASLFLLDVHCLGVKNAFFRVFSEYDYRTLLQEISGHGALQELDPACVRKLVEDAEAYATDLGFSPHPDYHLSRQIFGDVDKEACPMSFQFGKDGKPFYMSGPRDSPAKSKRIVDTLAKRCGPGGFDYVVLVGGPPSLEFDSEDQDESENEEVSNAEENQPGD
jgi:hypothetical protein